MSEYLDISLSFDFQVGIPEIPDEVVSIDDPENTLELPVKRNNR
jgi:hypothetical protein